jgi:hypothetical protein
MDDMKTWAGILALLWCAMLVENVHGAELLNPSFENPQDPNNPIQHLAAGWGTWGGWMNRETGWAPVRTGTCIVGYHHFRIGDTNSSGIFQDVSGVAEGSVCTFRIYACADHNTYPEKVRLRIEPCGGGEPLAVRSYAAGDIRINEWTELSVTATSVARGIRVTLEAVPKQVGDRDGALRFDDASLEVVR